jgi:hypothetical protein
MFESDKVRKPMNDIDIVVIDHFSQTSIVEALASFTVKPRDYI